MFGEWLSLVEHLAGGQGVAGSNPVSPTIFLFKINHSLTNYVPITALYWP